MGFYKIAICDDEEIFLEKIYKEVENNLKKLDYGYEIQKFLCAEALILSNCNENFDIVFLDIDMPETNGIEAAISIKHSNPDIVIIFITSKDELVYESIKTQPFRFIRKSKLTEEISESIIETFKILESNSCKLTIKVDNNFYKIDAAAITYIESNKNYVIVNTFNGKQFRYKYNISSMEKELEPYGFIRTHYGYLVNQKFIRRIEGNDVILKNCVKIPVSRSKKYHVQQKFIEYLR